MQVNWETWKMGESLIASIFSVKYPTRYSSGSEARGVDVDGLRAEKKVCDGYVQESWSIPWQCNGVSR